MTVTTPANLENASPRRKADGARTYWWAGAIAVPLLVATIGVLPSFVGGGSSGDTFITNSRIGGDLYFTTNVAIADPAARSQFEQALAFAREGLFAEAKALFERIAPTVEAAGVHNNLAVVNAALGDDVAAQRHAQQALQLDPVDETARRNLGLLARAVQDQRSNGTVKTARPIDVGRSIKSRLTAADDNDYFSFTAPAGRRDILRVRVENQTATFAPDLRVRDSDGTEFTRAFQTTAGGSTQLEFAAVPGATYYVHVKPASGDVADYVLSVTPLRAFDRFEPNDEITRAPAIRAGQPIEAGIMDPGDSDVYSVDVKPGPVRVVVSNRSTTLVPTLYLYREDKAETHRQYTSTEGSDVSIESEIPRAGTWYVRVNGASSSTGQYSLKVEQ